MVLLGKIVEHLARHTEYYGLILGGHYPAGKARHLPVAGIAVKEIEQ